MTDSAQTHDRCGPEDADATVRTLALKARNGSREAFEGLVERFQEPIYRMIYYRTRSRSAAEDLTQDTFLQAFRHLARLEQVDRFRGWLYSIALNRVRDHHRRQRFRQLWDRVLPQDPERPGEPEIAVPSDTLQQVSRKAFWQQVDRLCAQLSPREREVFTLRFMDQLTIRDVARALGKTESTVKTHLYRAIEKFQRHRELLELIGEETG